VRADQEVSHESLARAASVAIRAPGRPCPGSRGNADRLECDRESAKRCVGGVLIGEGGNDLCPYDVAGDHRPLSETTSQREQ